MLATGNGQNGPLSLGSGSPTSCIDSKTAIASIVKNMGIILDKPKHIDYTRLEKRQRSFNRWPAGTGQDVDTLSNAGFFYSGKSDEVTCFHCSLSLKDWSTGYDPWKIHAKLFPYCAHVRQCRGDAFVLAELGYTSNTTVPKTTRTGIDMAISRNIEAYEAVRLNYTDESLITKALEHLLQGNYFRSFTGVELARVIEEHMGGTIDVYADSNNNVNTDTASNTNEELDIEALEDENQVLRESITCKICYDNVASIVIIPCGHMTSCAQCISALRKCPLCRAPIKGSIRAIMQ